MRTLVTLLLLLNVLLLALQQGWIGGEKPAPSSMLIRAPFVQAPQKLVMLNELPEEQLALMSMITNSQARRDDAQQQLENVEQQAAGVQEQIDNLQAATAADIVQEEPVEAAAIAQEEPVEAEEVPIHWCATTDVFVNAETAEDFIGSLAMLGVAGQIETLQESVSSTWWVHMPPFVTSAAANDMLAELREDNIDSYLVTEGELTGSISLGVFSRQERAEIARQQFEDRGYETSIRKIDRLAPRHFASIQMTDRTLLESPQWAEFLASYSGVQVSEKLCEVIAPQIQFP